MDDQKPKDSANEVKYELYLSKPPDEQLIERYKKHVTTIVHDDTQKFNLKLHTKRNLCYGSVKFDDNIEKEWLIVYILYELSKLDQDLVIKVHDNYGDTLLIEAAEHLPHWLESSKSKNRVFIHNGKLHIIPEYINLKDLHNNYQTSTATVTQVTTQFIREMNKTSCCSTNALNGHTSLNCATRNLRANTLADPQIQDAIKDQLSGMPDQKAWLSRKFKQLDEIISENSGEDTEHLQKRFRESLSLASVMAMDDEFLRISPISSLSSSVESLSSSSWVTEQEDD